VPGISGEAVGGDVDEDEVVVVDVDFRWFGVGHDLEGKEAWR